ncbi:MAG: hypothetical protein JWM32_143 [Verrucomicrobia bacterium]|nr:hypothetical protein [Verrucomicrobiota bacterium]
MSRSLASTARLSALAAIVGCGALAAITWVSPAATRMYTSPWNIARIIALAAPVALLWLRAFDRERPLRLPTRPWLYATLISGAVVLVSGLCSPFLGPSLLWSASLLSALAVFLIAFDWLNRMPDESAGRRELMIKIAGVFFAITALVSLAMWTRTLPGMSIADVFNARNPYPLGHSNYTAGLALLMLPCFGVLVRRARGIIRIGWSLAVVLAFGMLFTSGSRGGLLGLAVLLLGGLLASRLGWKKTLGFASVAAIAALVFALGNPRTRAVFEPVESAQPNLSNLQRVSMLEGGLRLASQRPWLGWGPGTTPLAFPRVRESLPGGVDDVLQLHSLPVQFCAELGGSGLAMLAFGVGLLVANARRSPLVAAVLAAYLVFSLTDYQLDVPVFGFALAILAAMLAPPTQFPQRLPSRVVGIASAFGVLVLAAFARVDLAPELNVRALSLALDPTRKAEAITLLERSLALNPDQEIAHFNLGWLEVVKNPVAAERHFLAAAHLVPDKGGVYFGLGLCRLNRGDREGAIRAFALECLNDPIVLASPWWRHAEFGPLRAPTLAAARDLLEDARAQPALAASPAASDAAYVSALIGWFEGKLPAAEVALRCNTPERRAYFAAGPSPRFLLEAPVLFYRRARVGYPVLMRNLDLPVPRDLFEVQENSRAAVEFRYLFPRKGWYPGKLLDPRTTSLQPNRA